MGANSAQGWSLFLFLVGFTFLPAGLVYLGPLFSAIGMICLIASAVGFYRIKPLEHGGVSQSPQTSAALTAGELAKARRV
jgi:hypothetical protein